MKRILVSALAPTLLLPALALAQCPGSGFSTIPACFRLVGLGTSGAVDPRGSFTVTVRDNSNNGCEGALVKIDLTNCVDVMLAPQADQTWPGMTVDCTGHAVKALTDASGVAAFSIVGAANNPTGGNLPKSLSGCASITANNQPLGTATVNALNEDGTTGPGNGLGGNDVASWKGDWFTAGNPYFGRSDFDCNSVIGGNDLSVMLGLYFAGGSLNGPSGYCP